MEKSKAVSAIGKKRKNSTKITSSEPKIVKLENDSVKEKVNNKKTKKNKVVPISPSPKVMYKVLTTEEIAEKYPILKNKELVERFLKVPFNNNQKGRIRQAITLQLKASDDHLNPDAINSKIQSIIRTSSNLTDAELRRIRILYNMLNTSLTNTKQKDNLPNIKQNDKGPNEDNLETKEKSKKERREKKKKEEAEGDSVKENKEQVVKKRKGPKRYVLFVGNLPLGTDKEKILDHFSELGDCIKDVRIQKPTEDKKNMIAFLELNDEPSYELALSKHHTMLDNKRINVLYSTQKNSKISKAEAKSKSAKLIALQKSGKLLGSVPLQKKRSQRRLKMKKAQAKQAASSS